MFPTFNFFSFSVVIFSTMVFTENKKPIHMISGRTFCITMTSTSITYFGYGYLFNLISNFGSKFDDDFFRLYSRREEETAFWIPKNPS